MQTEIKVLDHGYVRFIESWGSDERVIESARMSTDKGFLGWGPIDDGPCGVCKEKPGRCWNCSYGHAEHDCHTCNGTGRKLKPGDEKLLRYLYENKHATPFEFAGLVVEVQAPIFVFREWHRHRTQAYNEMSARYTPLPDINYIPTVERLLVNSKTNKQAGVVAGADELTVDKAKEYRLMLEAMYQRQEEFYQYALRQGVPKELARVHLPVGRYSKMRASTCLRNWLAFLTLRTAPTAQYEIRQYAFAVQSMLEEAFPKTMDLFRERSVGP